MKDSFFEIKDLDKEEDDFLDIRQRSEQEELDSQLKTVLFGGYSKKRVKNVLGGYKHMMENMQEGFEAQLDDMTIEKERLMSEREILKKQLNEELEKGKDTEKLLLQLKELEEEKDKLEKEIIILENQVKAAEADRSAKDVEELETAYMKLQEQHKTLKAEYEKKQEDYDRLSVERPTEDSTQRGSLPDNMSIKDLKEQLRNLDEYCSEMERQQESLETQLNSMQTINRELDKIAMEYENRKVEYKEYQKKFHEVRNENDSLNRELESAGKVLDEVLAQFESKEVENEQLKKNLDGERVRIMDAMKQKLQLETERVDLTERLYRAENEVHDMRLKYDDLKNELEKEIQFRNDLQNKIIPMPGKVEMEESDDEFREVLNQAKNMSERLAKLTGSAEDSNEKKDDIGKGFRSEKPMEV